MEFSNIDNWLIFCIWFGLFLFVTIIMMKQSQSFYTKDVIVRKFSIMELEIPSTPMELFNLIKGLFDLPVAQSRKAIKALKGQLKLDYLFMPLVYGCIFLLCWRVAGKMQLKLGHYTFLGLAFLQVVPWSCDIIENIYILGMITPNLKKPGGTDAENKKHKMYLRMEVAKWAILLTAAVCSISAICYFWLTGNYSGTSFWYLIIVLIELILFLLAIKFFLVKKGDSLKKFEQV